MAEPRVARAIEASRGRDRRSPIELIALVPYPLDTTPSQRFRIEQWRGPLEAQGIRVHFSPFADRRLMELLYEPGRSGRKIARMIAGFARRLGDLASAGRGDAILIHRAAWLAGPALLERLLTLWQKPILFDFDDAIYLRHTSGANWLFDWLKFPGKTAALCRMSSLVIAGNEYLASYARGHNRRVVVVPTSIDTDLYMPTERDDSSDRVAIGWTGSATSMTHLEMFAPALRELLAHRDVEIRVQSNRPPVLSGLPFVWRPWRIATEIDEIRAFDIGIKPMPDDPWARGKCPMKELQYMALGIPTVCSAVGTSAEVIRDGENGFLANSARRYSMRVCATQFAEAIRSVVEDGHGR